MFHNMFIIFDIAIKSPCLFLRHLCAWLQLTQRAPSTEEPVSPSDPDSNQLHICARLSSWMRLNFIIVVLLELSPSLSSICYWRHLNMHPCWHCRHGLERQNCYFSFPSLLSPSSMCLAVSLSVSVSKFQCLNFACLLIFSERTSFLFFINVPPPYSWKPFFLFNLISLHFTLTYPCILLVVSSGHLRPPLLSQGMAEPIYVRSFITTSYKFTAEQGGRHIWKGRRGSHTLAVAAHKVVSNGDSWSGFSAARPQKCRQQISTAGQGHSGRLQRARRDQYGGRHFRFRACLKSLYVDVLSVRREW